MAIEIVQAGLAHIDQVATLFDQYRQFYDQPADLELARRFIGERLEKAESRILLARVNAIPAGFVQLFPSFSSVAARPIWILNDLYVNASFRRSGVGRHLMVAADQLARENGAARLVLETMPDNSPAQTLYQDLGWQRGETWHYELELDSA